MTKIRMLREPEIQIVHDWLRTMGMSVNRLLNREYADGFLIARLLKKMYPQLVNIHAYERSYSYDVKTTNWRTLNFKVLRRIGLSLTDEQLESLVRGEPGSIEQLMWVIMSCSADGRNFIKRTRRTRSSSYSQKVLKRNSGICDVISNETSSLRSHQPPKAPLLDVLSQGDSISSQPTGTSKEKYSQQDEPPPPAAAPAPASHRKVPQVQKASQTPFENSPLDYYSNRSGSTIYSSSSKCEDLEECVYENYKLELERFQKRVQDLESLLKQQDVILEMLRERANVYDAESRDFREVIERTKRARSL